MKLSLHSWDFFLFLRVAATPRAALGAFLSHAKTNKDKDSDPGNLMKWWSVSFQPNLQTMPSIKIAVVKKKKFKKFPWERVKVSLGAWQPWTRNERCYQKQPRGWNCSLMCHLMLWTAFNKCPRAGLLQRASATIAARAPLGPSPGQRGGSPWSFSPACTLQRNLISGIASPSIWACFPLKSHGESLWWMLRFRDFFPSVSTPVPP